MSEKNSGTDGELNDQEISDMLHIIDGQKVDDVDNEERIETTPQLDSKTIRDTFNRYKLDLIKDKYNQINSVVKDLKIALDRIDRGKISEELDDIFPSFIRMWAEKRFFKTEISIQASINGFFQYWMYKRVKKDKLNDENLNSLLLILSDETMFYNLYYTKD